MPLNAQIFQKQLITHGACTLARMKIGSLFRLFKKDIPNFLECIRYYGRQCSPFGYRICILEENEESLLVYVFHTQKLAALLLDPAIQEFLSAFGYSSEWLPACALMHLKKRLHESLVFPHEIGVFLGYPLQDIQAFIETDKQCVCMGYWRAYGRAKQTQKKFHRFDCCVKTIETRLQQGESLEKILKKCNEYTPHWN